MNVRILPAALAGLLLAAAANTHAQPTQLEWVAGQLGGGWYTMVTGMAKLLEERNPGMTVKVVPGGGIANPSKIQAGQSQLGMGLDIFSKMAREGTGSYAGKPHDKLLMVGQSFSDQYLHFIRADDAPHDFASVFKQRNIRMGVTKAGGSDELTFRFVMAHYGETYDSLRAKGWRFVHGDFNELASAYKDRQVDYVIVALGIPGAAVIDMAQGRKGQLLPWPAEVTSSLVQKYGFSPATFPVGTYPSMQSGPLPAIAMATTLMVSSDVPEEAVYRITKTLCENESSLPRIHASMTDFKCSKAAAVRPVPVHPGALKYYRERGFAN